MDYIHFIRGNVKIEYDYIGDSYIDKGNHDCVYVFRIDVMKFEKNENGNMDWIYVEGSSQLTSIHIDASNEIKLKALEIMMGYIYDSVINDCKVGDISFIDEEYILSYNKDFKKEKDNIL